VANGVEEAYQEFLIEIEKWNVEIVEMVAIYSGFNGERTEAPVKVWYRKKDESSEPLRHLSLVRV